MKIKRNLVIFSILLVILPSILLGQKRNRKEFRSHDVGFWLGGAYYIGDLNPRRHFSQSQPAGGIFYRFNLNYRVSFRFGLNYGSVTADDSQTDNADQLERNLNFKSRIIELQGQAEFNFLEYRISHSKYIFSPYIFIGFAGFSFNPMGNYQNNWVPLRNLATEGQRTSQNPDTKVYKLFQPSIPFGAGFKLKVSKMVGLGVFWSPRKTFTDYLDDVSGKYVNPVLLAAEKGSASAIMSDRSLNPDGIINNSGKQRGNPYTKDWYFFYGFTVSIQLKQIPKECSGKF